MNIPLIRLLNQQILSPQYDSPEELMEWLGAVQAQDLNASLWALALRVKGCGKAQILEAISKGNLIRVHVMRPTWHYVSPRNVYWMLELSRERNERVFTSFLKSIGVEIHEREYIRGIDAIAASLQGGSSHTSRELGDVLKSKGMVCDDITLKAIVWRAECGGVICGGLPKDGQLTYRLLPELCQRYVSFTKEEALYNLAKCYFRGHSPAELQDFIWWSGLSTADARAAIDLLNNELENIKTHNRLIYIHHHCRRYGRLRTHAALLPAYDEYLIGYKNRSDVLPKAQYHKAFNTHGIFYRIIESGGQIVGNWEALKNGNARTGFFRTDIKPDTLVLEKAMAKYTRFVRT